MVACHRGMLLPAGPGEVLVAFLCLPSSLRGEEQQFGAEVHLGARADIEELRPSFTQSLVRCRLGRVQRSRSSSIIQSTVFDCFSSASLPL